MANALLGIYAGADRSEEAAMTRELPSDCEAAADMTVALMLEITHMALWRANVGIVGGGDICKKVARRLQGFEVSLIIHDPDIPEEDAASMGVRQAGLDELMAESDIVVDMTEKQPQAAGQAAGYDKYMALIKEFLAIMSRDAQAKEKTAGKDISLQITFEDNGESCYLNFAKGEIDAGLGVFPGGAAEVNLRVPIAMFDGMMTGTAGAKAAMTGQMSFTGNARKAMRMQAILNLMMSAYRAAVAKVGPVDVASLGEAEQEATAEEMPAGKAIVLPATAPEAPQQGFFAKRRAKRQPAVQPQQLIQQVVTAPGEDLGVTGRPKTYDIRDELLRIVTEMFRKGLITGIGGNISVRCGDNPDHCWITPDAIFADDLAAGQMVRIDLHGNTVGGAAELPVSSEKNVHTAIYRARPDIQAVIHSHATKSTLMGLAGLKFTPVSSDAALFGEVPVVPFMLPGAPELGDMVAEAMGAEKAVCIMQNHGLVVAGTSLRRASDMTGCVEDAAAKILEAKAMGVELEAISGKDLEELSELGKMLV